MAETAREYSFISLKKDNHLPTGKQPVILSQKSITQCNTCVATEYTFFFLNCKEKSLFYEWRFMYFSNKNGLPEDNKTHNFLLFHTPVLLI